MNFKEYQELSTRTGNSGNFVSEGEHLFYVLNAVVGLAGEVGEVCEPIKKKVFHRNEIGLVADEVLREKLNEELGDLLWYISELCTLMNLDLEEVAENNVNKLAERYKKP